MGGGSLTISLAPASLSKSLGIPAQDPVPRVIPMPKLAMQATDTGGAGVSGVYDIVSKAAMLQRRERPKFIPAPKKPLPVGPIETQTSVAPIVPLLRQADWAAVE